MSELFYFKYPHRDVSIHTDTVTLSCLMPYVSDPPQWTIRPQLTPPPSLVSPLLPLRPFFSQRPVPLLSQSLLQLGSFPDVSEWVTSSRPPLVVCCDSAMSPPPLWMMSGCPREEVTVLLLSFAVHYTASAGRRSVEREVCQSVKES